MAEEEKSTLSEEVTEEVTNEATEEAHEEKDPLEELIAKLKDSNVETVES